MRIRYQQDQQSVQHTSIMSNKPFVFTLCDAGNTKVEDLKASLHGNLFLLETYSQGMGHLSKIFRVRDFLASATHLRDDSIWSSWISTMFCASAMNWKN